MTTLASTKEDTPQNVVIHAFSSPGQAPDVRLNALGINEFHVYSFLLKHHSAFFRKFLDSPDKQQGDNPRNAEELTAVEMRAGKVTKFRYEWVTQFDEVGRGWHLVAASNMQSDNPSPYTYTQRRFQAELFRELLCAIYNRPYEIYAPRQLISLVEMADYYCMLPTLSSTLDGVLHKSKRYIAPLLDVEALQLLPAAAKVRNELLFRECLLFVLGPYDEPRFTQLDDPKLEDVAELAFTKLFARIGQTQKKLWDLAIFDDTIIDQVASNDKVQALSSCAKMALSPEGRGVQFPAYYRALLDVQLSDTYPFRESLATLTRCDLELVGDIQAGVGNYSRYFFCDFLLESDLPWDPTETDW